MSDKDLKRPQIVEAQPLKPLPMPEYRFQEEHSFPGAWSSSMSYRREDSSKRIDLSGVNLNFS